MNIPQHSVISSVLYCGMVSILSAAHLWVEGESGRGENISRNGWYQSVRGEDLSGGEWLATYGGKIPAIATYNVTVPKTDTYHLWVRANPVQAIMSVQFNGKGAQHRVPISENSIESLNIASDGKPDMRFVAWTKVGEISLPKGENTVEFKMSSANGNHGAIDCFCLNTDSEWKPSKAVKPGETGPNWPAPKLTDENIAKWGDFIRPVEEDLGWRQIRWHRHLDEAVVEAKRLNRPILLWSMNGHPCGET
jgi:hypothetical protein